MITCFQMKVDISHLRALSSSDEEDEAFELVSALRPSVLHQKNSNTSHVSLFQIDCESLVKSSVSR